MSLPVPVEIAAGYLCGGMRSGIAGQASAACCAKASGAWTTSCWNAGGMISCDRDYFVKDGRPMPVVGMTYMTSDVARKFLFLPNAAVWDRDMAQMKRAGINWIRTGIWTA